jgi:7-cyano-7-deazaguanine synthase in queuosine biosynthesis
MKKRILQAVSGGYDSTYLMTKNLQSGNEVFPIYIHASSVHPIKQHIEYYCIKKIIEKLQEKYSNLNDLEEINIKMDNLREVFSIQPILWILGLFNEVKNGYNSCDEIHIGYIMQDGAISYISEIKTFWKSLFSFSMPDFNIPKLVFPLIKYPKDLILRKLDGFDDEIFNVCWTCEKPSVLKTKKLKDGNIEAFIEPCGKCNPCNNIKDSRYISFDALNKYKAVVNVNDYLSGVNTYANNIIKKRNLYRIPSDYISLSAAERKRKK